MTQSAAIRTILFLLMVVLTAYAAWALPSHAGMPFEAAKLVTLLLLAALVAGINCYLSPGPARATSAGLLGAAMMLAFFLVVIAHPFLNPPEVSLKAACLSNLKRLSLQAIVYSQDNDETFPPAADWATATAPYTHTPDPRCPLGHTPWTYAMNVDFSKFHSNTLDNPADFVLFFDSDSTRPSDSGSSAALVLRHEGLGAVALADGQVKVASPGELHWDPLQPRRSWMGMSGIPPRR